MDNLTHTLAGALLAECGLKHRSRLAYPALLIGANLPDIDVAVLLSDQPAMGLYGRRGLTHGVLAMVVLPVLLTAGLRWWSDWRARRRGAAAAAPQESFVALWGVALIAVLSHPLLDLVNSYGVRLLMPFSGRWFYGDSIFIVDPWILAILISGVWFSRRMALGSRSVWIARGAAVVLLAYIGSMAWVSRLAAQAVAREAGVAWPQPANTLMMSADPARFATRSGILANDTGYTLWSSRWTMRGTIALRGEIISKGHRLPCTPHLLESDISTRYLTWSRFPFVTCTDSTSGQLNDARYLRPGENFSQVAVP